MKVMNHKGDFPIYATHPQMIYLDHAATSHKPEVVIKRTEAYYNSANSSPHRGAYKLSVKSTELYDRGRQNLIDFLGADERYATVFTKNATEALNLIAHSYVLEHIESGDEICVSIDAHHSVIVPLQLIAKRKGATLKYLYLDQSGIFENDAITSNTKILALPWIGNGLGKIHDVKSLLKRAHDVGAVVILDGAQAIGHIPIDFSELDVDFFTFSGHKMYAPQGIGGLVAKKELLETMPPFLSGGDMIEFVTEQTTTFAGVPERFEAGTQNVAGVVGLMAAIDYIKSYGLSKIHEHEMALTSYALEKLKSLPFVDVYGPEDKSERGALITFNVEGIHPHDVASLLDEKGVSIRAGHHCTQPLMKHLGISASCRISYGFYNTTEDIDSFMEAIRYAREVFGYVDVY